MRKLSPAKVNLYLRVLRKRQDGYHDIASLMQRISLCDEMIFKPVAGGIRVRCPGSSLPENEENIVFRAAEAFFRRASHISGGIDIAINKKIPVAAGLGGGSSNAATTLVTLNELFGCHYTKEDLMKIGATLGADVPFFIFERTAWAFGIGERLQVAEDIPSFSLLVVNPGFALSTKMIYKNLNLRLTNETIHYSIPRFSTVHEVAKGLFNDLETVSIGMHPVLADIKKNLMTNAALGALMSGSGPTVFGIFEKEKQAIVAEKALAGMNGWVVFRAASI
ncbi:MAG: 4-(cytidine 5'-diphospho)-2-C-methyl-D-erythritol kinase [Deltaproteobacteria bacterium HGW-Deltaproteobacteria-9]|nr:MAG: 4-(cytidine 5'-diphospho)-2-C-methyl-D-erythritol kinase [Deltaproteobacteria bacterium HGW-Deltaproteobacteria-9]